MADIHVERKGRSVWPWVIGLAVLALLVWAITELLDADRERAARAREDAAVPPAAAPAPGVESVPDIQDLLPLGSEDAGQRVRARGTVVGDPTPQGYWLLTDQDDVIFVMTPVRRQTGENVEVTGTLLATEEAAAERWKGEARLREATGWRVHDDIHLHVERGPAPAGGPQGQGAAAAVSARPAERSL